MKIYALVGDFVARLHQPFQTTWVVVFGDRWREDVLQDRRRDDFMRDGRGPACLIESGGDALQRGRAVNVVLHVLFTRPDDFDRFADGARDERGLHYEIGQQPAPEASAEQSAVDRDL